MRSTVQSFFAIGAVTGMFVVPILNDMIGRRKSVLFNYSVGIPGLLLVLLGIQKISYPPIFIGTLMTGISASGYTMQGFIMTCDFC